MYMKLLRNFCFNAGALAAPLLFCSQNIFAAETCTIKLSKTHSDFSEFDVVRGNGEVIYKDLRIRAATHAVAQLTKDGYCRGEYPTGVCGIEADESGFILQRRDGNGAPVSLEHFSDMEVDGWLLHGAAERLVETLGVLQENGYCDARVANQFSCEVQGSTPDASRFDITDNGRSVYHSNTILRAVETWRTLSDAGLCRDAPVGALCSAAPTGLGGWDVWRGNLLLARNVEAIGQYRGRGVTEILGGLRDAGFCEGHADPVGECRIVKAGTTDKSFQVMLGEKAASSQASLFSSLFYFDELVSRGFCTGTVIPRSCSLPEAGQNGSGVSLFNLMWGNDVASTTQELRSITSNRLMGLYHRGACSNSIPTEGCAVEPVQGQVGQCKVVRGGKVVFIGPYSGADETTCPSLISTLKEFNLCR